MLRAIVELPGPTLASDLLPTPLASNVPIDNNDGNPDGDPNENLQEWSSLIGIITAIVGNVLIALALNVQRYAHIKLHKERHRIRRRAKNALKRAQNGHQAGSYGTLGDGDIDNGYPNGTRSAVSDSDHEHDDSCESDPLRDSFHSSDSNDTACENDEETKSPPSSYLKSPYWWLGQVLITLGEMGNFLAYGFAPASIVSPIGVVALISNCIIAPAMFHEKFRQRDFWGVVIAVGGVVTVVLSANQEETKLDPHAVWGAITTLAFEIYLGVTIFLIICLMWLSPKYGRKTILIDLGLVGLFGGYTALSTKGVASMLSSTLWRAFATPVTYVLVLILLLTAIMQIRYVNKALQRFDSTQVIPIQFVMFTLCVIIGSAVLYRDFERTTPVQAAKFVGGCLLTFFGVFLITSGRGQNHDNDDDDVLSDAEGIEETIGLLHHDGNPAPLDQNSQEIQALKSSSRSRRSSRLSQANDAETGRLVTPSHDGGIPSMRHMGANGSHNSPSHDAPIHNNPWQDVGVPSTPPGRGVRTISTDSVLTAPGGGNGVGSTTATSTVTSPLRDPLKEAMASDGALVRPNLSPTKSSGSTHHHNRTFISPSPLSSTVTAVVKDAFLRGDEDPRLKTSSMRRLRSQLRAGLFFGDDSSNPDLSSTTGAATFPQNAVAHASEDVLFNAFGEADGPADNGPDSQARRRSRSLSDTLGDFFGVRRKDNKDDHIDTSGEGGTADLGENTVLTDPRYEGDTTMSRP